MRAAEISLGQVDVGAGKYAAEKNVDAVGAVSPLVLHGPSGCGKSHLAQGLAHWLGRLTLAPGRLLSAADFSGEFIDALEDDVAPIWRRKIRESNWLVIEDLWQIAGKTSPQQELIGLLDILAEKRAPVIVTLRVSPSRTPNLLPALVSRLNAGLSTPVATPGVQARRMLLAELCAQRGLPAGNDFEAVLELLARDWPGGAAGLFGALHALENASRAEGQPIDAPLVRRLLAGVATPEPTLSGIAVHTARHFKLTLRDLKSPSRRRAVVTARGVAMYLARQLTPKTLEQIGAYFGGRDHTTVLHGCRQVEQLVQVDPSARRDVATLHRACSPREAFA